MARRRDARGVLPWPAPARTSSLTATEALVGFYNDYGATIGKDVVTPLFHPENHSFDIRGSIEAKAVVGYGAEYRVRAALKARVQVLVPKHLREVLVDEVCAAKRTTRSSSTTRSCASVWRKAYPSAAAASA